MFVGQNSLSVRSAIVCVIWPGMRKKTGMLHKIKPRAPQKYLMTKSSMNP